MEPRRTRPAANGDLLSDDEDWITNRRRLTARAIRRAGRPESSRVLALSGGDEESARSALIPGQDTDRFGNGGSKEN
jgi:hypothetical protein